VVYGSERTKGPEKHGDSLRDCPARGVTVPS
jgi:hypothetical protein